MNPDEFLEQKRKGQSTMLYIKLGEDIVSFEDMKNYVSDIFNSGRQKLAYDILQSANSIANRIRFWDLFTKKNAGDKEAKKLFRKMTIDDPRLLNFEVALEDLDYKSQIIRPYIKDLELARSNGSIYLKR